MSIKDPQIDTYLPADPLVKKVPQGPPITEGLSGSISDSKPVLTRIWLQTPIEWHFYLWDP